MNTISPFGGDSPPQEKNMAATSTKEKAPLPPTDANAKTATTRLSTSKLLDHYKSRASALLTISTFAATVTFSVILTPRDSGTATPGLVQLAYANSLFC